MKGNIRRRGDKQGWQITVWTGKKPDGKPIRHYETVRGSKADAQRRLRELLTSMDKGSYVPPTKYTVKDILYQWLEGYIGRNPCELVDPPSPRGRTMRTLSAFEVGLLLDSARDNYYYPVVYTAVSTGLRRNELLGLRWRDVDLDLLSISVSQTLYKGRGRVEFKEPKTEYSRRRVSMTPKLALFLREYKAERESLYCQLGVTLTLDDLVFTNEKGKPIDPSTLTHNFGRIVKRAGLVARFHDLRHSYASLMLAAGVHPKIVSEALGHSTVAITLDIYSHVTPGLQEAAAKQLDSLLPVGVTQRHVSGMEGSGGEV